VSEFMEEISFPEKVQKPPLQDIGGETPVPQFAGVSPLRRKWRSRHYLWLAIILIGLLIVGMLAWLLLVLLAPNTNPWQRFTSTKLSFSVLYPADWQMQIDYNPAIVHFYDSTQTDKVDVRVSTATTVQLMQFLQQQASQLGMTDVKTNLPRLFAGSSWQQVQGKLSQEGVSYTVLLLATLHGKHLYLLIQIAPQSTYNDEEALVFSSMRAGWLFSS
jgi:hypothetical protein